MRSIFPSIWNVAATSNIMFEFWYSFCSLICTCKQVIVFMSKKSYLTNFYFVKFPYFGSINVYIRHIKYHTINVLLIWKRKCFIFQKRLHSKIEKNKQTQTNEFYTLIAHSVKSNCFRSSIAITSPAVSRLQNIFFEFVSKPFFLHGKNIDAPNY